MTTDTRAVLQDALRQLRQTRAALEAMEARDRQPIAVLGAGVRLPGDVHDLDGLWALLSDERDAVVPMTTPPDGRREPVALRPVDGEWGGSSTTSTASTRTSSGSRPSRPTSTDPQQRLLLEVAWEALEDAGPHGRRAARRRHRRVRRHLRQRLLARQLADRAPRPPPTPRPARRSASPRTGCPTCSTCTGRAWRSTPPAPRRWSPCTSRAGGLRGRRVRPRARRRRRASSSRRYISPAAHRQCWPLSPDGRCKTFDASADGYRPRRGLRRGRAQAAQRRRARRRRRAGADPRHRGQPGRPRATASPLPTAARRAQLMRAALANAASRRPTSHYVEAHGTGTPLGDPIEIGPLAEVVRADARPSGPAAPSAR